MMHHAKTLLVAALLVLAAPAAWAAHPVPREMDDVQELAHELEIAAQQVRRTAEGRAHHGTRREQIALEALHRLEDRAAHFHRQVERYSRDPYHTENDFTHLVVAYDEAQRTFRFFHGYPEVREDFARLAELMEELSAYYGDGTYRPYYRRDRDPYDGYGNGRFRGRLYFRW